MKALLIGATGATGKDLLQLLLNDEAIEQVDVFVRRPLNITHPKLHTHVIDFNTPDAWKALVTGDVLFSCLGTTLKAAGSKDAQWKVDFDYQYHFAQAAFENRVHTYVLVSAENASADSVFFYSKMKGKLEEAVRLLAFPKRIVFNPPLLIRDHTDRAMEVWAAKAIGFFNRFGILRSQTPLRTSQLAAAMLKSAKKLNDGQHAIKGQDILKFS